MDKNPIYIDALTNVWHHELSPENTYNDIDYSEWQDGDYFDEYEENLPSFF